MRPSLYALFSRSKYFKEVDGDDESQQRRHLQKERFAVASIAFCLKHDEEFRRHFLATICSAAETGGSFDILVEDKHWGDLVLVAGDRSAVFVIECKINADLEPHQDPSNETSDFWLEGYGKEILDRFSSAATHITYVVFGYARELDQLPIPKRGVSCTQKFWEDLKMGLPDTRLIRDLSETLASLDVAAFRSGKTDNMKKSNEIRLGSETYGLLNDVLSELKLLGVNAVPDISYVSNEDWYFGLAIKTKKTPKGLLKQFQKNIRPLKSEVAWFGYAVADKPDQTKLSVWYYCKRSQIETLKKRLINNGVTESLISTGVDDDGGSVLVETLADQVAVDIDDKTWFKRILAAAL